MTSISTVAPRFKVICIAASMLVPAMVLNGTARGDDGNTDVTDVTDVTDAEPAPVAPRGLLPVRDYTGPWDERAFLSGDWAGARTKLAEFGVSGNFSLTQVYQGVIDGGRDEVWKYGGKLRSEIALDLDRMGFLPGALVNVTAESRYGESANNEAGALLPINSVMFFPLTGEPDENIPVAVTELRYTQFLSEQLAVFFGKFIVPGGDVNEFAGGRGESQFLSSTLSNPSVASALNPYSALGTGLLLMPARSVVITSSILTSNDASTTTGFSNIDDGLTWSNALRFQYSLGDLAGGLNLAFQYGFDQTLVDIKGKFLDQDGMLTLPVKGDSWNTFSNWWQYLYVEEPSDGPVNLSNGRADLQGIGLFARLGFADRDTNPAGFFASGGVGGRGIIPGRDDDTFGIGFAYTKIEERAFVTGALLEDSTNRVEAYYALSITPAVVTTLDVQYADTILAPVDPAWLLGLRLRVSF